MANHPQNLLQQRIYTTLTADATLMALIEAVYDSVPDNEPAPFISFGEFNLGDWGSHTSSGVEGEIQLDVWSEQTGKKEVLTIMNRLYEILHNIDLDITGFPTIVFRCALSTVLKDPDGRTHHGIQRYRIILGGN